MKFTCAILFSAALLSAPSAHAGETACWLDRGVLVVPAMVAGIPGDFILDTGTPHTVLHADRAQGAGFDAPTLTGDVTVAGLTLRARPLVVASLDARTFAFPTPIAGVLGADVLEGLVLDIRWSPDCRVGLRRAGAPPPGRAVAVVPLSRVDGEVAAPARATDGRRVAEGQFVLATGAEPAITLNQALTETAPEAKSARTMRLRAISFAGGLTENATTRIEAEGPDAVLGVPVLRRRPLRFDLAHNRLWIFAGQQKGPPAGTGRP